jgi:uncharacterized protein YkwD
MRTNTKLAVVGILGIVLCWPAYSQTPVSRAERDLFVAVNKARRAEGLAPLRWDDSLATAARRHAEVMAEHRSAQHGFAGEASLSVRAKQAGAHFNWLSENVVEASSAESIHAQFINSPAHRANILDRDMDSIGIGVIEEGGQLFAVEDFSQAR